MKTLTNKPLKNLKDADGNPSAYAELAKVCLQTKPKDHRGVDVGFDPEEMGKRIRIQNILEKGKREKTIELEDADAEKLLKCMEETKWRALDPEIYQFTQDLKEELGEKKKK